MIKSHIETGMFRSSLNSEHGGRGQTILLIFNFSFFKNHRGTKYTGTSLKIFIKKINNIVLNKIKRQTHR